MDIVLLLMQLLILACILVGGYLIRNYLPSYFGKKGENLATKEDIEEITHKIERTRSLYLSEIEYLKSYLHITNLQQSKFIEQQRDALLEFFDDCVVLIQEKMRVNLGDFPSDQGRSLFEYQESTNHLFTKIYKDYHRLILYFGQDSDLPHTAEEFVKYTIETEKTFKKRFGKLKIAIIEEHAALSSGDQRRMDSCVQASNKAVKEYHNEINPSLQAMQASFQRYMIALNKYLQSQGSGTIPQSLLSEHGNTT